MSSPPPEADADHRPWVRTTVAVVAALVVVLGVTAGIIVGGLVPLPEFPHLADEPETAIQGTVAYITFGERDGCVVAVEASGGDPRELACLEGSRFADMVAWTEDGLVVAQIWGDFGAELVILDPETGDEVGRVSGSENSRTPRLAPDRFGMNLGDRSVRADGAAVRVLDRGDGRAVVAVAEPDDDGTLRPTREILEVEGPRDYAFGLAQWSPDGRWILVGDSRGRLLILDSSGERVWVLDDSGPRHGWWGSHQVAWYIPGDDTYTVDLDERR